MEMLNFLIFQFPFFLCFGLSVAVLSPLRPRHLKALPTSLQFSSFSKGLTLTMIFRGHGFFLLYGYGGLSNQSECISSLEFPGGASLSFPSCFFVRHVGFVLGYIMREPVLNFFSFIALMIGIFCGSAIRRSGYKNYTFALVFLHLPPVLLLSFRSS